MRPFLFTFIAFTFINTNYANEDYVPQQIHLSYTNDPTEMMITWVTLTNTTNATVRYSLSTKYPILTERVVTNNITNFTDGGSLKRTIFINRVKLSKLTVVEAAELSKQLEEKWGVTAAAPVAAAPAAGAAAPAEEKSEFTIFLAAAGDKKINVL